MRTIKALALLLAKREGKTKQVSIAQIYEILGIMSDLAYAHSHIGPILWMNGFARAKRQPGWKKVKGKKMTFKYEKKKKK